jgi:LysR family hydrogen peroxide-inducible transcriptional activator
MVSIQQMQYLVVLSEEKQFQRASERCFVTQPTLSMQVKKAEEMLGFPIFDRSSSPLELTPFGEEVIEICREILDQINQLEILQKQMKGEFSERIRIGIIPTISSYLIPKMFPRWQLKFNKIQIQIKELKSEELLESLENKSIDLAIMAGPVSDQKWRSIPLFTEEIKAYIPSFEGEKLTTDFLDSLHPWLLNKGNCLRTQMMQFCQIVENENPDQWNYEGGSVDMLIKMVDINGGYTLVPNFYIDENQNRNGFYSIFSSVGDQNPVRSVIGLFSGRSYKKNIIEELIREIQHTFPDSDKRAKHQIINWK